MIGKEVKLVKMDSCRYIEDEFGLRPMLAVDAIVESLLNQVGTILEYDYYDDMYLVSFESTKNGIMYAEEWLYRNEFLVLIRNLLGE